MNETESSPPRVALIGVTGYGKIYLDWLLPAHDEGRLRILAATVLPSDDASEGAAALRERGARFYRDYSEMLAEQACKLDICFIPTGIHWHARMTIAALQSGANVLVEKPLAGSPADVELVRQAEADTGRWVAVGFQDIYTDEIASLKKRLIEGEIGRLESIRVIGTWPRPVYYFARNDWAGRLFVNGAAAMDSPLNNAFAHFVNLALFLAGPAVDESAKVEILSADLWRAHDIESFDTAVVRAWSADKIGFWFGVTHACRDTREPEIHVIGSQGRVEWRHEDVCTAQRYGERPKKTVVPKYDTTRSCMFEAVLRRLRSPEAMICHSGIAARHAEFIDAVHRAAEVVPVPASAIEDATLGGETALPTIRGIEQALQLAFEGDVSLAEVWPGFARPQPI